MNLCDCYVTEVLGAPYQAYGRYWLNVKADDEAGIVSTIIMFSTLEEALEVGVGYHFLA